MDHAMTSGIAELAVTSRAHVVLKLVAVINVDGVEPWRRSSMYIYIYMYVLINRREAQ